MVLYFTGTGNSRYIAKKIADETGDETISLNEKIKNKDLQIVGKMERLVFVVPTYGWRIPRIVKKWIEDAQFAGTFGIPAWFVMDCGSEIGNAAKYNKQLCEQKGFSYMGTAQIVMPENYIAMFGVPMPEEAKEIIRKAEPAIQEATQAVRDGKEFPLPRRNGYDRFMSCVVNPVFYRFFVKADHFYAKDTCNGCGKCKRLCPLNNIELKNGKPIWGRSCTHCMACISYCPMQAIEYGKKSEGKPRYHCD